MSIPRSALLALSLLRFDIPLSTETAISSSAARLNADRQHNYSGHVILNWRSEAHGIAGGEAGASTYRPVTPTLGIRHGGDVFKQLGYKPTGENVAKSNRPRCAA